MKSHIAKLVLIVIGSLVLVVSFQNCGQAGSINELDSSLSKAEGPLVADVVSEMQNQDTPNTVAPVAPVVPDVPKQDVVAPKEDKKEYVKEEVAVPKEEVKKEDNKQYDNELENVLQDHSCEVANGKKVLICHYPPGNPAARHELCISRSALQAHMHHQATNHQDTLGRCPSSDSSK